MIITNIISYQYNAIVINRFIEILAQESCVIVAVNQCRYKVFLQLQSIRSIFYVFRFIKSSEYLRISNGYLAFSRYNGNKVVIYEGLGEIFEDESADE